MSHLFKEEKKIYFKYFKIFIILIVFTLFLFGFNNFNGNKINYISFSLLSNFLIFFAFRRNAFFFETFFALLLWLGFWFKLTCTISFTDGVFREGVGIFDYSKNSFDEVLFISQIAIFSFILSGYFREFVLFKYPKKLNIQNFKNNLFKFGRKKIWIIFIILIIITSILNIYFKIYQKGLLPIYDINFLISGIFKWLLLFGLSSISASLIFYEFNFYQKFFIISILIAFIETFFSSFSMLSRGMIFNSLALLYGIYKFSNKINSPNNFNYYLKSILTILVFFYISVSSVNYIRANYFYVGKSVNITDIYKTEIIEKSSKSKEKKYSTSKAINFEILYLMINRWVGIDGVMAVNSKKESLSLPFLYSSFNEKASKETPTFYELSFGLEENSVSQDLYENVKGNTLPGIVAFIYYSGSYYILFFLIFFLSIISSFIEFLSFKLSSNNLIFSSLIGQVIAFRLIHFGYLPHQSYLLFGSIFLTTLLIYIINFFLNYKNK